MELLNTLGIDWQLLVVQLINFFLLIGVLTFLLYRPVLRLLDERQDRIKRSMDDVKKIENQKKELDAWRVEQMKKIDLEAGKLLEQSRKQAEDLRKELVANAEREATQIVTKAKEQLEQERTRMMNEVQGMLASIVVKMTEKVLQREFSGADQERIAHGIQKDLPALLK